MWNERQTGRSRRVFRWVVGVMTLLVAEAGALAADPGFIRPQAWAPYFRNEKGVESNLAEPLEKIDAKTWVGLQWTDFQGPKLRLAVLPVENKAAQALPANLPAALAAAYGAQFAQVPVSGIEDLLCSSLQDCHRFRLFERKALAGVMAEKALQANANAAQAQAGVPASPTAVDAQRQMQQQSQQEALQAAAMAQQAAKLIGAQYSIYASVVEWTPDKSKKTLGGGGMGSSGVGFGSLLALAGGLSKTEAEVAMSFRIVDSATGEVKWSLDERATAGNWGFNLGGGGLGSRGGGMVSGGLTEKSPVNYAVKACINKAVYRISMALRNQPWRGAIIKATGDGRVYINAGSDAGLRPGMALEAVSLGEELKDPDTGEVLDREVKPAGEVRLTEVRERIAIGTLVGTPDGLTLKAGDRVEIRPAEAPRLSGLADAPGSGR